MPVTTTDKGQQRSNDGFKKVGGKRSYNKDRSSGVGTDVQTNSKKPFQKREYKDKKEEVQQKQFDPSKPFCKVCKDAGKTEEEYTNHFVRESAASDAPVVCPTLLAQACRYCRKDGHTVKYCPALSSKFNSERSSDSPPTSGPSSKKFSGKKSLVSSSQINATKNQDSSSSRRTNSKKQDNDSIKLTTQQIMASNPFGALHDGNDADDEDDETLLSQVASNVESIVAKKQWDDLHSGKTLNYGDLKVKCVNGKLVFEVVKEGEETSTDDRKPTWASVVTSKSS